MTENQKAFKKERNRLLRAVQRGKKQGYIFPEDIIPELPKRVSQKSLEKIRATKPKDLYKKAKVNLGSEEEFTPETRQRKAKENTPANRRNKGIETDQHKGRITGSAEPEKVLLTPEQRKEINRARGQKAWKTRRAKMSDEEYAKYIKNFVEKTQKARAEKLKNLTPEELEVYRQKNKARGRKAWETRRARMTDEEYAQYIQDFVERTRKGREKGRATGKYPQFTVTDSIRDALISMVQPQIYIGNEVHSYPISARQNYLLEMLEDTVMYMGEVEAEEYFAKVQAKILSLLDFIMYYASVGEDIEVSFSQLGVLINGQPLSPPQAEALSYMTELYNGW